MIHGPVKNVGGPTIRHSFAFDGAIREFMGIQHGFGSDEGGTSTTCRAEMWARAGPA
jgi:hypothetical protein